eukprot:m.61224 g.61224  ORF g.61224 m.61224 type:complete len:278 (+) comp7064_c0_seq4:114-947(+)
MRRRWAPPGRSSTVCVGLTDGSRTMETKAVLVDGCTAAVNKAIKDLERFQAEYATRPIPPPVDPLLLPIYTQLKREELRALLRSGLALANKNDSETNGHDNSLLLSAPVVFIDIILALFPLLFQRENMDRLAMLQVKRWTCLVSPKIDLQWLVQDSAASEYVNEYGRRTAVDPALDAQVSFFRMGRRTWDHKSCGRCSHPSPLSQDWPGEHTGAVPSRGGDEWTLRITLKTKTDQCRTLPSSKERKKALAMLAADGDGIGERERECEGSGDKRARMV